SRNTTEGVNDRADRARPAGAATDVLPCAAGAGRSGNGTRMMPFWADCKGYECILGFVLIRQISESAFYFEGCSSSILSSSAIASRSLGRPAARFTCIRRSSPRREHWVPKTETLIE